ncbi:nitronate monooxygenase [Rhizobium sp. BK418]|nr:nitronate monooxygenase [Rhizobium sp. BK418]
MPPGVPKVSFDILKVDRITEKAQLSLLLFSPSSFPLALFSLGAGSDTSVDVFVNVKNGDRMALPPILTDNLRLPVIGSPLFIISHPALTLAQCKAGVIGAFPALNARPESQLDEWLAMMSEDLAHHNARHPERPAAPFAVNQIVHMSNKRLEHDLMLCVKYKVPIVISSLGAVPEVNAAVHSYGGIVLHDIINNRHANSAIRKGADGLIAVAAGAGGHAGTLSPFALVQEIRAWFDGPLLLAGAIATGDAILAAQAMGADMAYIGTPFIATEEARAADAYKQAIVEGAAADIVYSNYFTGVHGNYLKPSIRAAGLDPDNLPDADPSKMDFEQATGGAKAWKDIWGSGQGIGAIKAVEPVAKLVDRLEAEYQAARARLAL